MTDYIKREDVLALSHYDDHDCEIVDVEDVEKLPSADVVERKKGKWVGRSENDCYPVCSECGCTRLGSSLGYCQKYVPFCEHCGADMRGKDNG